MMVNQTDELWNKYKTSEEAEIERAQTKDGFLGIPPGRLLSVMSSHSSLFYNI